MPARKSKSLAIVHQPGAQLYRRFVEGIKERIRTAQLKANRRHPSLGFQKKGGVYTVEVGRSYRAIARERDGEYYWFWIGTHEEYNRFRF